MTIKQFQAKLDRQAKNLKTFAVPLQIAAFTTTAKMGERIFDEGKKTDESQIGQYSENPAYVSLLATPKPKGAPTGKPSGEKSTGNKASSSKGKSKFKNGKPHKSKFFALGYKGYRSNVGRQTSFVDLSMTGELRMDFSNDKKMAEPRKISDLEYQIKLDKEIDQKKREGMEEKYGTIFSVSEAEKELFYKTIQFEFNNRLGIAGSK